MAKRLKKCPFCGSKAEIVEGLISSGGNHTGKIPEGAVLVRKHVGNKHDNFDEDRYYWERRGYSVTCSNSECLIRNCKARFNTLDEAIEKWNTRANDYQY